MLNFLEFRIWRTTLEILDHYDVPHLRANIPGYIRRFPNWRDRIEGHLWQLYNERKSYAFRHKRFIPDDEFWDKIIEMKRATRYHVTNMIHYFSEVNRWFYRVKQYIMANRYVLPYPVWAMDDRVLRNKIDFLIIRRIGFPELHDDELYNMFRNN